MSIDPRDIPLLATTKPDDMLLGLACSAFMHSQLPSSQSWRLDPMFNMEPGNANVAFSIVTRECRAALEDNQYKLQYEDVGFQDGNLQKLLLRGDTSSDKRDTELLLRTFSEHEEGRVQLQNIAMMRYHLSTLCEQLRDCGGPAYTMRDLAFLPTRRRLQALAKDDTMIGTNATDIVQISEYLERKTSELVTVINAQQEPGEPTLVKQRTIGAPGSLGIVR